MVLFKPTKINCPSLRRFQRREGVVVYSWNLEIPGRRSWFSDNRRVFLKIVERLMLLQIHVTYPGLEDEVRILKKKQAHDLNTDHFPWPQSLASAIINQVHSENTYTLSPSLMPGRRGRMSIHLYGER